jgi:predicted transcriptional regulator of viral defense system
MKFDELLSIVAEEPVFETSLLLAGDVDPVNIRRQISRWTSKGRLIRLRSGLYALAPPFRKVTPHPFVVANRMVRPSYVSLQSALSYHSVIPETVPVTTSVTTARPGRFSTALGDFIFRHLKAALFRGFRTVDVGSRDDAVIATPEKALLDLLYLEKGSDSVAFLDGLRLELGEGFDTNRLGDDSEWFGRGKVRRAVGRLIDRGGGPSGEYEEL